MFRSSHRKPGRYRKTAKILAEQIPPGEVRIIGTWEGPATAAHPAYQVWAATANAETWPISEEFFDGPFGYELTGEICGNKLVYQKKPGADVLAYQVDTDDHEPVEMANLDEPFQPPRGYWIVTQLDGSHRRAVAPDVFASDFEPSNG